MNILIVDDHDDVRDVFVSICKKTFPESAIFQAEDGVQAIDVARRIPLDLVILDINLRGIQESLHPLSGIEVAAQIRKAQPNTIIQPYSFLVQYNTLLQHLGCEPMLAKPVSVPVIIATLQRIMANAGYRAARLMPEVLEYVAERAVGDEYAIRSVRSGRVGVYAETAGVRLLLETCLQQGRTAAYEVVSLSDLRDLPQLDLQLLVGSVYDLRGLHAARERNRLPMMLVLCTPNDVRSLEVEDVRAAAAIVDISRAEVPPLIVPTVVGASLRGERYLDLPPLGIADLVPPFGALNPAEWRVAVATVSGVPDRRIAEQLSVEAATVTKYKQRIREKIGGARALEIARYVAQCLGCCPEALRQVLAPLDAAG